MILSSFCFATILLLIICVEVISLLTDWKLWQTTENASQHTYFFLRVVPTPSSLHNPKSYFNPTSTHCGIHMWAQRVSLCPICCITEMARYAVGTIGTEQLCTQPLPEIKPYRYLCFLCDIFLVYWIYCYMEPANYNLVLKYLVWQALFRLWLYTRTFIVLNFHWIKGDSTN